MAKKTKKAEEVLNENNVNVTEEVVNENATQETEETNVEATGETNNEVVEGETTSDKTESDEVVEERPNEENTEAEKETVDNKEVENTSETTDGNEQLTEITEEIPVVPTESVETLGLEEVVEKGPSEPIENEIPVRKRQRLTWEWNGMIADF